MNATRHPAAFVLALLLAGLLLATAGCAGNQAGRNGAFDGTEFDTPSHGLVPGQRPR